MTERKWVVVPVEATEEMFEAGYDTHPGVGMLKTAYPAMLATRPLALDTAVVAVVEAAKNWRKIHGPPTPQTSSVMIAVADALSALAAAEKSLEERNDC